MKMFDQDFGWILCRAVMLIVFSLVIPIDCEYSGRDIPSPYEECLRKFDAETLGLGEFNLEATMDSV